MKLTRRHSRILVRVLALLSIVSAGVLLLAALTWAWSPQTVSSQGDVIVFVDVHPNDGCQETDTNRVVNIGETYTVGLCVSYAGAGPDSFRMILKYNGGSNVAPEVADAGDALDDNPDFNEAVATNAAGWSCTGFGVLFPKGDNPATPGVSDAVISCNAKDFSPTTLASPALLATVTFQATAADEETLTIGHDTDIFAETCGGGAITCNGATIVKGPTETPTATATQTSSPVATNTPTHTLTPTATATPTPLGSATPGPGDVDGDSVPDASDNCPSDPNANQANSPVIADNGPAPNDDANQPNDDVFGDLCDLDSDNDGIADLVEMVGCAPFGPTDPGWPVMDDTYDDNGDGNPMPPLGTDLTDDGPSWDTDGDMQLDGFECAHGSDPTSAASKMPPFIGDDADDDGDRIPNGAELRGWGSRRDLIDTDRDGRSDCAEIADFDGNGLPTFSGDTWYLARAALVSIPPTKSGAMDHDKNGAVTFSGDVMFSARVALVPSFCPAPEPPLSGDADFDGVADGTDNCRTVYNPGQVNTIIGSIDNGPQLPGEDLTVPFNDLVGDACDTDTDNDGVSDTHELTGCAGNPPTDPGRPALDTSYDDDADGDAAIPLGQDVNDDGPSWDSDADGFLDGWECIFGYNPADRASRPAGITVSADTDSDGLLDAWESRGWATRLDSVDSDLDGKGDCVEAADIDGNGFVTYSGDGLAVARAALRVSPLNIAGSMDIDKNGAVTYSGDALFVLRAALAFQVCQ